MNQTVSIIPYVYIPDLIYFPSKKKEIKKKKPIMIFEPEYKIKEIKYERT